jgi:hypothetical protein
MTKLEYQRYLKTPYWRARRFHKIRSQISPGTCEDCNGWFDVRDWNWLHVHHLSYERVPYRELDSDLEVLCKVCHAMRHDFKNEEVEKILNAGYALTPDQCTYIRRACVIFDSTVEQVEVAEILTDFFQGDE